MSLVERLQKFMEGSFPGDLGIEPLEVSEKAVRGRLLIDRRHLHPRGYVQGGVWVAFADSVAAWGTILHLGEGASFSTAELKVNVFAAAVEGDELLASAEPLHIGSRTQVWEVRITKNDRLAANFVCTQMVFAPRA